MNNVIQAQSTSTPWFGPVEAEPSAKLPAFEPYVDEHVIARFLQIKPRRVLEMARNGQIPAHPIGRTRKTWRFRISEIDAHFSAPKKQAHATMTAAVPGTKERNRLV
jgi:hypothetical protein